MRMDASTRKLAYSIPEAVAATGIGRSTLYQHIKAGSLIATKIGGRTVILSEHLTAWLSSFVDKSHSQPMSEREAQP